MKIERAATFHVIHGMRLADRRATIRTIPCSGPRRQDNSSANGHDNRKIAETTLPYNSSQSADSKKLQFMVFVFVCIFFAVLGLVFLCSGHDASLPVSSEK